MGNTLIFPIGYRLNNICDGKFLGWTNEGKTQFRVMPHGFPLPPPREKIICSSFRTRVFFTRDLTVYAVLLGKEGRSQHWYFECMLSPAEWIHQWHLMVTKLNIAGLKLMYKKSLCLSKGELTQARGVRSMTMWDSVPVKNFIVPVLHLEIGLVNYFFFNFLISLTLIWRSYSQVINCPIIHWLHWTKLLQIDGKTSKNGMPMMV